jgi:predicted ATPase
LIDALERAGYARTVEAGRAIIQDQVAIGGAALPWLNPAMFAELMLSWEMRSYHIARRQVGCVFFDRGVPDVVGYLFLTGSPVPAYVAKAAETFRYNRRLHCSALARDFRTGQRAQAKLRGSGGVAKLMPVSLIPISWRGLPTRV